MRARRVAAIVTSLLTWPATLAHELAHAAVATPGADHVAIEDPLGTPSTRVEWGEEASRGLVIAAAYAPTVSGIVVALLGLVWGLVAGWPLPASARQWVVVGIASIWYGIYVMPSASDVRTVEEVLDRE